MNKTFLVALGSLVLGSFPIAALTADFSAPIIDLPKPAAPMLPDSPLEIRALVDDDNGIQSVVLYYRIAGESNRFERIALSPIKDLPKTYGAVLPPSVQQAKGIEYYVEAKDFANNVTQEPFPNDPKKIVFATPVDGKPAKIEQPSKGVKLGAGTGIALFSVADPDGNTNFKSAANVSGILLYQPRADWRIWADLGFQQFQLPYSQTEIGQNVRSIHTDIVAQMRIAPSFWGGVGAGIGMNRMKDRATSDNGFILEKFDDREVVGFSAQAQLTYEIGFIRKQKLGLHARFYKSIANDIEGLLIGVYTYFSP